MRSACLSAIPALLTVARRLGRDLAASDTLARLGGDQFGAIVLMEQNGGRIEEVVEAMRDTLATPISFGEREVALTVSIGVARFDPGFPAKGSDLHKDAEIAMANAKKRGGDRIEYFEPGMRAQRADQPSLAADLRRALDRGEIRVLFQPIVRLEDRTVAGFEAQLRWQHPRLGQLGPPDFMPLAEETGFVVDLGVFAMQETARELAAWQRALEVEPPIFASINISSRQLLRHDLLKDVQRRAQPQLCAARHAEARTDREPGDGESRIRRPDAAADPRDRRRPVARRFRDRLFLARPSPALSFRHAEDRSVAGAPERGRARGR